MKQKKKNKSMGLGSGLSSLLGTEVEKNSEKFKMVPVELIKPGPWQPRKIFDKNELVSLSNSIIEQGIVQPIILKSNKNIKNQYFIIAGERRWRACQLALINNYYYTQEDISKAVGKSRSHIANIIRLLSLSDMAKETLLQKKLTIGQIRPLIGLKDIDTYIDIIIKKNLTSRQVEELVRKRSHDITETNVKSVDILQLEKELSEITGLNVNINFNNLKKAGNIKLECKTLSEFNYIIEKIKS